MFSQRPHNPLIPDSLISTAAKAFAEHLKKVTEKPEDEQRWVELLQWPKLRLTGPTHGHKIKRGDRIKQLRERLSNENPTAIIYTEPIRTPELSGQRLERRVRHRIDAGDTRGAVRLVINEGRIIEPDITSAAALKANHPAGDGEPLNNLESTAPIEFTEQQLRTAIEGMQTGGAPGPDGLRPVHVKQMTGPKAADARETVMAERSKFIKLCLSGLVPPNIRHLFFGANLLAFKKKDGGLRPIAVGLILRRLTSRVACAATREMLPNILEPIQLGVGTRGGAEIAAHATRRFLANCTGDSGIVKLDFANAFNSVNHSHIMNCVIQTY